MNGVPLRYYLVAVALVCMGGGIAASLHRPGPPLQIRGVHASGSPSASRNELPSGSRHGAFVGEAPWALSALPECLSQQTVWKGTNVAVLRRHVPPEARAVNVGTVLQYNNCRISVHRRDAFVLRGVDRIHIPPSTSFFTTTGRLFVLHYAKHAELRAYTVSKT